jgi:hypothetical protein
MRPPQPSTSFSPSIDLGDLDDLNVGANQRGAPSRLEVDCFHFAGETLISLVYIAFLPVE